MTISSGLAMSWQEWRNHDAVGLAELVRARQVAPKELCAQAAEAVTRIDPQIEAVLGLYDDVLADPDADRPNGEGLLYGVPILLKDLGSGLAGRRQESGSKLFKDHTVEATDPLVDNYLRAGLIPIGRSTTPEFGMTFDTATEYLERAKVTAIPGSWNGHQAALLEVRRRPLPPACCRSACLPTAAGPLASLRRFAVWSGSKPRGAAYRGRFPRVSTSPGSASTASSPAQFATRRRLMII